MQRRLLTLAVSIGLALLGTSLVLAYVVRADARAVSAQEPVAALVAEKDIPAGTALTAAVEQGLLVQRDLPRSAVPIGALEDVAAAGTRVTASTIYAGETVLPAKLVDPTRTGALSIPPGRMAVSVLLSDPGRVAGFVVPGSEVAIFTSDPTTRATAKAAVTDVRSNSANVQVEATKDTGATRMLLPRVTVLAIGPRSATGTADAAGGDEKREPEAKPVTSAVLTVAVTQPEAEKLLHAAWLSDGGTEQQGEKTLAFALLTAKSETAMSPGTSSSSLFK